MFGNIEQMKNQGNTAWLFAVLQDYKDDSEKGWMTRLDAAEALVQLGDSRGLDYLHEMADSPNKDIREIALEILDGLKDYPVEPIAQVEHAVPPKSESMFFKINAKYPYIVAWAVFVVLYFMAIMILNPVITLFFVATQPSLSQRISSLVSYLLLLIIGFFVFRFVIRLFVLPYENKH